MDEVKICAVSFYVPCLNEEGNVGRTIDTLVSVMERMHLSFEILVVDDASTDGTAAETLGRIERYPQANIKLIQNTVRRGLGRNYFLTAQRAQGEYYMLACGDASEPPEAIQAIVSLMGKADAVVPYFGLNDTRTLPRRFLSLAFTGLVNLLSGNRLRYYNGPVLHRTENVRNWFSETMGFAYQAELLCRLLNQDQPISVVEVQIANYDRETGASKAFTAGNLLSVTNALFHIALRRLERLAYRLLSPQSPSFPRSRQ